jgi:hypothetical protein
MVTQLVFSVTIGWLFYYLESILITFIFFLGQKIVIMDNYL